MDFMLFFDVIILGLGVILIFKTIQMKKTNVVPTLFLSTEDMNKCKDVTAFIEMIYKKGIAFALISIAFGIEGLLMDVPAINEKLSISAKAQSIISVLFIAAFVVVWFLFSKALRKGRELYFSQF